VQLLEGARAGYEEAKDTASAAHVRAWLAARELEEPR
jgi:hypothetical protein